MPTRAAAATTSATTASPSGSGTVTATVPGGAITQTHEYKELGRRLHCQAHPYRISCRINRETSEHTEVEPKELSLWAHMIVRVT